MTLTTVSDETGDTVPRRVWGTRLILIKPTIHDDLWCIADRDLHGDYFFRRVTLCGRDTTIFSTQMNRPEPHPGECPVCTEKAAAI